MKTVIEKIIIKEKEGKRQLRDLPHMVTRMTRWLAGSHIIHTHTLSSFLGLRFSNTPERGNELCT